MKCTRKTNKFLRRLRFACPGRIENEVRNGVPRGVQI